MLHCRIHHGGTEDTESTYFAAREMVGLIISQCVLRALCVSVVKTYFDL